MIRKLSPGKYRLYSRKKNPRTGKRRNLGTFPSRAAAARHERAIQYFKRHLIVEIFWTFASQMWLKRLIHRLNWSRLGASLLIIC